MVCLAGHPGGPVGVRPYASLSKTGEDHFKADHEGKFGKLRILDKQIKNMSQRTLWGVF